MELTFDLAVADVIARLEQINAARDSALNAGRRAIRLSANAIREIHRGDLANASVLIDEASALLDRVRGETAATKSVYWAGYVQDAMKEFAEASVLLAIVSGASVPTPASLNVEDAPFLNGLGEAASELRRLILHTLRGEELDLAGRYLESMNDIYDVLITIDFPDAITGGLRRTVDQLRAVLERTRGDFTLTVNQRRLETAIRRCQSEIMPPEAT